MLKMKRVLGSAMMIMTLAVPMAISNMPVSADISIQNLYTYSCTSKLSISGSTASCVSEVNGYSGKTTKIVITQILQKKNSSGSWSNAKSSNKTVNSSSGSLSSTYSGLAKGTYRLVTSATVYAGNNREVVTSYSSTKTVK